jgi:signal transduction histidine kinase
MLASWLTGSKAEPARSGAPVAVAIAYYLGAQTAFLIGTLSDQFFAPFWPPNTILFCALFLAPYGRWWLYIALAIPAHVVAELQVEMPAPQIAVAFVTNCLLSIFNALALRYLIGTASIFDSFYRTAIYIAVAVGAGPALVAFLGAFVRIGGDSGIDQYWTFWGQWYVANSLAGLTLGPILLAWALDKRSLVSGKSMTEAGAVLLALVIVCAIAFKPNAWQVPTGFFPAFSYLPLPFLIWAAARFGAKGASAAILVVTVLSLFLTLSGPTVFAGADPEQNVLGLQLFLTGLAVPVLLLGALISEGQNRERTAQALARSILHTQDHERRHISWELHERIAQDLVGATLIAQQPFAKSETAETDASTGLLKILRRSIIDLRSLSYVLHPALLDEEGLRPALSTLVDDNFRMSGIRTVLEFDPTIGRLAPTVELTLYRLTQEALSNVRNHSRSKTAYIRVLAHNARGEVELIIADGSEGAPGTGLAHSIIRRMLAFVARSGPDMPEMRERMNHVGGRIEVDSTVGQTIIRAVVPISGISNRDT